jgi:hypothetical protein
MTTSVPGRFGPINRLQSISFTEQIAFERAMSSEVECGDSNSDALGDLVGFMVVYGGLAGGFLLLIMSGCTCRPSQRRRGEVEEEMFDPELPDTAQEIIDELVEQVDLTDGIDGGEEGVIAKYIALYLCKEPEGAEFKFSEKRLRTLGYALVWVSFLKKLGLKLILLIPLLLRREYVPCFFFLVDGGIFIWYAGKQKYFPFSLYNEVHVLLMGRKFRKVLNHFV